MQSRPNLKPVICVVIKRVGAIGNRYLADYRATATAAETALQAAR